jgi:hypothetical protein
MATIYFGAEVLTAANDHILDSYAVMLAGSGTIAAIRRLPDAARISDVTALLTR